MKLILDTIQLIFMVVTVYFLFKNWKQTTYSDKIVQYTSYIIIIELLMVFFNDFDIINFVIWTFISGLNFMDINKHLYSEHKRIVPEYCKTLYDNTVGLFTK